MYATVFHVKDMILLCALQKILIVLFFVTRFILIIHFLLLGLILNAVLVVSPRR